MTFTLSDDDILRCREISTGKHDLIMDIVKAVCEHVGIPVRAILSDARTRPISHARWLICYIAHVEQGHGVEAIARVIRKDHSSVVHGVKMERERRALVSSDGDKLSVDPAPQLQDAVD